MGTVKLGNNYLLWVESATPGTYNYVDGQGDLKKALSMATIDTSNKVNSGWASAAAGLKSGNITLNIKAKLPDANGFSRLETLAKANPQVPFNIQIRKGGTSGTGSDVVFACSVYCTGFDDDYAQDGVVSVSATFVYESAPTTDTLA